MRVRRKNFRKALKNQALRALKRAVRVLLRMPTRPGNIDNWAAKQHARNKVAHLWYRYKVYHGRLDEIDFLAYKALIAI